MPRVTIPLIETYEKADAAQEQMQNVEPTMILLGIGPFSLLAKATRSNSRGISQTSWPEFSLH